MDVTTTQHNACRRGGNMAGKTIGTNLRLRLRGWEAAVRSKKTPEELRKAIRRNIKELRARLRRSA
jgi:hypothetical protein